MDNLVAPLEAVLQFKIEWWRRPDRAL